MILNGHEYVAVAAQGEGIGFTKEGNCFTEIANPQGLARVADAWPRQSATGRLGQACDRWSCTACLCFGLDLAEQERSGFRYGYSACQAGYSRNLLFASGAQMEALFDRVLDRTRSRLGIPAIRAIFGLASRPHRDRQDGPPAQEIVTGKHGTGSAGSGLPSGGSRSRPAPRASTCCAWRPPCTTRKSCAAAAAWTTPARSSPGWQAWPAGSPRR